MTDFLWAAGCLAFLGVICLVMSKSKSKWREELGDTGDLDPSRRVGKHPALGAGYRDGPTLRYGEPRYPREAAEHRARNHVRDNWPTKQIILTPRDLEHINIRRRQNGRPPMNAAGFRAAIAEQSRTGTNPIHPVDEWLAYLIAFELLYPEHQSHRVAVDTTIAIEPDEPFNGQFGGAGATGSFDVPDDPYKTVADGFAATTVAVGGFAAALGAAAALAGAMPGPDLSDDSTATPEPSDDAQPQADPPAGDSD